MRFALATILVLLAGAAQAQAPLTGTTAPLASPNAGQTTPATVTPAPARTHRRGRTLQEQFDLANSTHDGHLTEEQARAHMPAVARDFAKIDTAKQGYVTVDQIRDYRRSVRAAHRAAKKAAVAKP